eukprot:scaffold56077_cov17-Tisochrysis_lutea.AAC.1
MVLNKWASGVPDPYKQGAVSWWCFTGAKAAQEHVSTYITSMMSCFGLYLGWVMLGFESR